MCAFLSTSQSRIVCWGMAYNPTKYRDIWVSNETGGEQLSLRADMKEKKKNWI